MNKEVVLHIAYSYFVIGFFAVTENKRVTDKENFVGGVETNAKENKKLKEMCGIRVAKVNLLRHREARGFLVFLQFFSKSL